MLTVNSQTTAEIIKESRHFSAKLGFGSKEYEDIDSFTYTSHFSPNKFTVGCVTSASVQCDVRGLSKDNPLPSTLKGQVFKLMISVGEGTADNPPEWLMLGEFKITEAKLKDGVASITAYDKLNFVSGTYTSTLTGKKNASVVFAEVCGQIHDEKLGFKSEYKDENGNKLRYQPLTNDYENVVVDKLKGYPLKDVLSYLACLFGRNVVVNRQGLFEIRQYDKKSTYALFNNDRIETPDLAETDSVFGYLSAALDSDTILTAGDTTGSGFLFACPIMSQTRLDSLSNNYSSESNVVHSFRPGKVVQLLGDPRIEAGDVLPLNPVYDKDGNLTSADCFIPVMSLVMKYDGGLMNEITAYDYEEDTSLSLAQKVDFADKSAKRVTQYASAVSDLTSYIGGGLGLYKTEMTDASGAVQTYLHDGETISQSTYIITVNSNGFAFSTTKTAGTWLNDASNITWTNGVTRDGNAVMKTIAANKITADMIDVSELSALKATIGGWKIIDSSDPQSSFSGLFYPSKPNSDGTYSPGMGLAPKSTVLFYAGYVSTNPDEPNGSYGKSGKEYDKGTPWEYDGWRSRTAFFVEKDGSVTAKKGKISGWTIGQAPLLGVDAIYSTAGEYEIGMQGSSSESGVAFYVKHKTDGDIFYVKNDGSLKATKAEITGKITATSGTIGGFDIKDPYMITSGKDSIGVDGCLYFNSNGSKSTASVGGSGSISSWVIAAGKNFGVTSSGKIYATSGLIGGFDLRSSYMITSGKDSIGVDGCLYFNPKGSNSKASVGGSDSISGWMIAAGKNFGVTNEGILYTSGAIMGGMICTGVLLQHLDVSDHIELIGSSSINVFSNNQWLPAFRHGKVTRASDGKTLTGLHIGTGYASYLWGDFFYSSGEAITSDEKMKKSISDFDERHESMFLSLNPKTFQYIDGTSGRTHFGFVAQQVEEAIIKSDLTTKDVAAFVAVECERNGQKDYTYALRYGEFVALNTHMIQKCLKEIETLKNEISILKGATT